MKSTNFWAKLATALVTLSLAGGAIAVTSCGEDNKIETPDDGDEKPGEGDNKPGEGEDKPGEETTTATVTLSTPIIDGTTVTWTGRLEVKGNGSVDCGFT